MPVFSAASLITVLNPSIPYSANSHWIPTNNTAIRTILPGGHGHELVSSVRALVPLKPGPEEELMYVKSVEAQSPQVGVVWKFEEGFISSGVILVT
ncbi:hypothetical protein TNCV_239081 [Trichonephila clavipes]|nr:hypothetical protein TNCV_239081 [Trichonephila clavipes]